MELLIDVVYLLCLVSSISLVALKGVSEIYKILQVTLLSKPHSNPNPIPNPNPNPNPYPYPDPNPNPNSLAVYLRVRQRIITLRRNAAMATNSVEAGA